MLQQAFEQLLNDTIPNDKDKTYVEAIIRFIKNEITQDNINDTCYREPSSYALGGAHLTHSAFSAVLYMLNKIRLKENVTPAEVENIIDLLMEKNPEVHVNILYMLMQFPTVLDILLKKISKETKLSLFKSALLSPHFEIQQYFFVKPESTRVLINHGLPVQEFIDSFEYIRLSSIVKNEMFASLTNDVQEPSHLDTKEYAEFYHSEIVKIRNEIMRRMRLSLQFPSKTEKVGKLGNISFMKSGASFIDVSNYFKTSLQNNSFLRKAFEKAFENKELETNFLESERKQIFEEILSILLENKREGNRAIPLSTDRGGLLEGHAEGLLVFDDLLMKVNRGARAKNQPSGIVVFKKSPSAEAFLSTLPTPSDNPNKWQNADEFDQGIANVVLPNDPVVLSMKAQKTGNCTWATNKGFMQATCFAVIRKYLINKYPEDEEALNKKAAFIAQAMYKDFSKTFRIQEIKNYFEIHDAEDFRLADKEILRKMIINAVTYKEKEILEKIKGNTTLCNLMAEENQTLVLSAIKQDDLELLDFILTLKPTVFNEKFLVLALKTAINENAVKTIAEFNTLIGPIKEAEIKDSTHPLLAYGIIQLLKSPIYSDMVIALLNHYNPLPYTTIIESFERMRKLIEMAPENKTRKNECNKTINIIKEFCYKKFIQDSQNEILKILEQETDPKQKIEAFKTCHEKQKSILEGLIVGLPSAKEYERIFQAKIEGLEQANTTIRYSQEQEHEQPMVSNPTPQNSGMKSSHKK